MTEEILFFIREEPHGFLSNYERTPLNACTEYGWKTYRTNEHFYQAMKANNEEVHDWIRNAPHARIAMVIGRQLEHNQYLKDKFMKPGWGLLKNKVMLQGLRRKFSRKALAEKLLATGDAVLHENNPDDPYWGVGKHNSGNSYLGKLLMQVRDEIKASINNKEVR